MAHQKKIAPGKLSRDDLTRLLCDRRQLVSFFNDFATSDSDEWVPAVQYLGTKGFFADYDARPNQSLSVGLAKLWAEGFVSLRRGEHDGNALAAQVGKLAPQGDRSFVSAAMFAKQLGLENSETLDADGRSHGPRQRK